MSSFEKFYKNITFDEKREIFDEMKDFFDEMKDFLGTASISHEDIKDYLIARILYERRGVDLVHVELNMKMVRLTNLLGDIVNQATNDPQKLVAFNSPLLQLACIELYKHNNPDAPEDKTSEMIFRQLAEVGFNG